MSHTRIEKQLVLNMLYLRSRNSYRQPKLSIFHIHKEAQNYVQETVTDSQNVQSFIYTEKLILFTFLTRLYLCAHASYISSSKSVEFYLPELLLLRQCSLQPNLSLRVFYAASHFWLVLVPIEHLSRQKQV